jgi:hypothetical protein
MTVYRVGTIHNYIGLSTDTMPTGVPVGSRLFAIDNKSWYVCYDKIHWTSETTGTPLSTPSASNSPSNSPSASPSNSPSASPSASPST